MIESFYDDYLIRTKEGKLFKVSYKENEGIYYESIINNKILNRRVLHKNTLKYFYVFEDNNREINFIYQDLFGNINLNIFTKDTIEHKDFFCGNKNYITPLNFKGIFLKKDLMLVYKMDVDNKIYLYNYNNKNSSIVYDNKSDIYINYRILNDEKFISLVIYSVTTNIFKLILKIYNINNGVWSNDKVIFINEKPYIDMSFCISNSILHSLFIVKKNGEMKLIYKYNNLNEDTIIQRELIIYENNNISSCLVIEINKIIWLFWISEKKMYCCSSLDFGESFSKTSIYLDSIDDSIRKIDFIDNGSNKEIYISQKDDNIIFTLERLMSNINYLDITYKDISYCDKSKKKLYQINIR